MSCENVKHEYRTSLRLLRIMNLENVERCLTKNMVFIRLFQEFSDIIERLFMGMQDMHDTIHRDTSWWFIMRSPSAHLLVLCLLVLLLMSLSRTGNSQPSKLIMKWMGDGLFPYELPSLYRTFTHDWCPKFTEKPNFTGNPVLRGASGFGWIPPDLTACLNIFANDGVFLVQMLTGNRGKMSPALHQRSNAEHILGISDVVSHLLPYLFVLDPALVYEVSVNLLSLADVPGGKPEWASAPITALLTLWDRQEFSAGRESIVRAVVKNLQLLDLHLQVPFILPCSWFCFRLLSSFHSF